MIDMQAGESPKEQGDEEKVGEQKNGSSEEKKELKSECLELGWMGDIYCM